MTQCPICGGELDLANNMAYRNADTYDVTNRVLTECCDQFVNIIPIRSFRIEPSYSRALEDDWGNEKVNKNFWYKEPKK